MTRVIKIFLAFVFLGIAAIAVIAATHYHGDLLTYAMFTLLANALLLNGFRKSAIYFDTFIGVFFWLGFWLKLSVRVAFTSGVFRESVGVFDGSGSAFDEALVVSSCGISAFLFASLIRERFFVYPREVSACSRSGLFLLYQAHRKIFVGTFILAVFSVALINAWFGIYQRGMATQTNLPFGLNGVFKWLLQFGLASVSALIIRFEIELNRSNLSLMAVFPPILETLFSNVSLLSRGMILNSSALAIGGMRMLHAMKRRVDTYTIMLAMGSFILFFALSVVAVNYLRHFKFDEANTSHVAAVAGGITAMAPPLFIDRWVGIEGVMAVSSSEKRGWELWREAWQEQFQEGKISLYDRALIHSSYADAENDKPRNHFVSLPGLVAFLYYPGSLAFLFFAAVGCAHFAALLEITTYRFCGRNWVLCSLFAQVIAYRYASFGYVPRQSFLLFGTLVLNGLIVLAADYALRRHYLGRREAA